MPAFTTLFISFHFKASNRSTLSSKRRSKWKIALDKRPSSWNSWWLYVRATKKQTIDHLGPISLWSPYMNMMEQIGKLKLSIKSKICYYIYCSQGHTSTAPPLLDKLVKLLNRFCSQKLVKNSMKLKMPWLQPGCSKNLTHTLMKQKIDSRRLPNMMIMMQNNVYLQYSL